MQETLLYRYWEYYAASKQVLQWRNNSLRIISAGKLNEHEGPDYQGARFEFNGILFQGAVEMHITLNDWYNHQHHYNPAYREVQLHVVLREPTKEIFVTHSQHSHPIPTFTLPVPTELLNKQRNTCSASNKTADLKKTLQQLAINRLQYKVHLLQKKLQTFSVRQLFYQGYLKALGYPHNKYIFEWLALRVTEELITKYKNSAMQLLALYLGCAGFLDINFQDPFALNLEKRFKQISMVLRFAPISKNSWQFAAVRPLNHPHFRLAGWVALVSQWSTKHIFDLFFSLIQQRLPYNNLQSELQSFFSVKTDGYWQGHYALEKPIGQKRNRKYLGPDRIKEVITNLLIPLSLAYAHHKKNYGFVAYLEEFYLHIPGVCSYQSIYRRRPWLKEYKKYWPMFNLGQAFIELEESYCRQSKCDLCPLGRKQLHS